MKSSDETKNMMWLRHLLRCYEPAKLDQEPEEQQIHDTLNQITAETKLDTKEWAHRIRMIRKEHSEVEIYDWEAWIKNAKEQDIIWKEQERLRKKPKVLPPTNARETQTVLTHHEDRGWKYLTDLMEPEEITWKSK